MKMNASQYSPGRILSVLSATLCLSLGHAALAQPCPLTITTPNVASITIGASPNWYFGKDYNGAPDNLSYIIDNLISDTSGIAPGTSYPGWCIDTVNGLDPHPENYTATLYSSCDPNLPTELPANYPSTVYAGSTVWKQINYLLNHKNGAYFYDIQVAIWNLMGADTTGLLGGPTTGYPPVNPNGVDEVTALVTAARLNAANWQFQCGNVIAIIVAVQYNANDNLVNGGTTTDQLTIFEYPYVAASVSGNVVLDCNGADPAKVKESPLAGVTVSLFSPASKPALDATTTDNNGYYAFANLAPGTYTVQVTPPANYTETWPSAGGTSAVQLTLPACQNVVQNFGFADNTPPTVTCPPNVTVAYNYCPVFCTFTPSDWGSSCNDRNGTPTWWCSWDQQNHSYGNYNCMNTWSDWYNCWTGNNPGGNIWNFCQNQQSGNNSQSQWWGGSCNPKSAPSWCASWNYGNPNNNWWLPCNGNNPGSVLANSFSTIYNCGYVQVGSASGNCIKLTSCDAVRRCLGFSGNAGALNTSAINPSSCSAGSFCAQVLALQLNCDFGDAGVNNSGFGGACGDLIYNDSSSPCNGQKVRDILKTANCVLGGGKAPSGCSASYLCGLCGNLNQCFEGCQVSSWCKNHLVPVYIPPPCVSGKATATAGACLAPPVLTYCDTVASGACPGSYVITRTWTATSGGTTGTCKQLITITPSPGPSISGSVVIGCASTCGSSGGNNWNNGGWGGGSSTPNFSGNAGLPGVTVTLYSGSTSLATTTTDANGNFSFNNPGVGTYTVVLTPPAGYVLASPTTSSVSVKITSVCQTVCNLTWAICPNVVVSGDTATIGFWHNKNGQALINSLNGGSSSTALGSWLAVNFPNLYGASSVNNMNGKLNSSVAALFQTFFNAKGAHTQAQILGAALACYVTDSVLAGNAASSYGFNISTTGIGVRIYNVQSDGKGIGLSNNTSYTVMQLLLQANADAINSTTFSAAANYLNDIFDGINSQGDIN